MASTSTFRTTGLGLFAAGLVAFVLSTLITDGFVHGMFLGMTIALMVGAAYLFGAQRRRDRRDDGPDLDSEAWWLPSQDEHRE